MTTRHQLGTTMDSTPGFANIQHRCCVQLVQHHMRGWGSRTDIHIGTAGRSQDHTTHAWCLSSVILLSYTSLAISCLNLPLEIPTLCRSWGCQGGVS